jgi:two-component system nitrogen regulation sensor histidine kinase GlnL
MDNFKKKKRLLDYEDIVESLIDGIVAVDCELTVVAFNQAAEKISEVSRTLVLGRPVSEVFERDPKLIGMLTSTLSEGKLFAEYEEKLYRGLSGPLPVAITTNQIFDTAGELAGAVAIIKDLSLLKTLEASSLRKDRLAYIGAFAANLAHEIKNPLSGIRGAAQLFARRVADDTLSEYTDIIIKEVDRLDSILREMLNFARPARLVKKELNIHKVLDSVLFLTKDGNATFMKEYDPSLPPVSGDEGQLTQVFLNLVKNAKEAAGENGTIRIITRMITEFHLVEEGSGGEGGGDGGGKMAAVEIKDNGVGIRPEDLEKIFTPFFTTKDKGSGLGMAISLKIIKEHSGFIRVDSEPGEYTTVTVYLPVA